MCLLYYPESRLHRPSACQRHICVYVHPNIYFCFSNSCTKTQRGTVAGWPKAIGYSSDFLISLLYLSDYLPAKASFWNCFEYLSCMVSWPVGCHLGGNIGTTIWLRVKTISRVWTLRIRQYGCRYNVSHAVSDIYRNPIRNMKITVH